MSNYENAIKGVGSDDMWDAVQCTVGARDAGFFEEIGEDILPDIFAVAIGDITIAFNEDVPVVERDSLVQSTLTDVGGLVYAGPASISKRGDGCQFNIPAEVMRRTPYDDGNDEDSDGPTVLRFQGVGGVLVFAPSNSDSQQRVDEIIAHREAMMDAKD